MRQLLAEMDKPAPHHNGMMQLSNELADLKSQYQELQEVVQQRNGECDRLIKEQQDLVMLVKVLVRTVKKYNHGSDLAKRAMDYLTKNGLISAADFLRGGVLSAHDQVDTAPAQFESLAGNKTVWPHRTVRMTFSHEAVGDNRFAPMMIEAHQELGDHASPFTASNGVVIHWENMTSYGDTTTPVPGEYPKPEMAVKGE